MFVGVDLTAGLASSGYDYGPDPFPAVLLGLAGDAVSLLDVRRFDRLTAFRTWVAETGPTGIAIDGPCGAVGIALRADRSGFAFSEPDTRPAERALVRDGIRLFWTTRSTVERFDGAARWIARSLALFEDLRVEGHDPAETHPHGVFLRLAAEAGVETPLPAKTSPAGRRARVDLLRRHIDRLDEARLPDDDHVDAAAAALLAVLRHQGRAVAYGDADRGGRIWLPGQARSKTSASTSP